MSTKEDIINYVMTTPHNTNRSVLTSLLDGLNNTELPFYEATIDVTDVENITLVSPYDDLHNAILDGKIIICKFIDENFTRRHIFDLAIADTDIVLTITLGTVSQSDDTTSFGAATTTYTISSDNSVVREELQFSTN